ncbi:hypothetical protein A2765_06525 [Candidatus Kaiserbacteria bacterium RIFCSPHIGHO2_01_FULL_56_24]|uniref:SGNH hydrolase-type esterase domain-containing protein n=1 Tax=Candidatus Kaiserbacteria bacterium RIFCSPHIGHO2_01_FULL_56_24 TaxID=1798487 RepID=A0A1F6D8E9_9BACT|nr:MAG: hypothetical protein A2765_06525 [Candidatus Kaiserbacteria bacterium RIFCSPHIGHO2_01_FULL_56_24]
MRTRYIIAVFAAAFLGLGAYWYFLGAQEVRNYPSGGTDIIAFGDSLIAGVGASPGRDFVSLLSQKIGQPIVNLGVSGDTAAGGLARLSELDAYNPKVVIVLFGGNDYLRRVPQAQTFENLTEIVGSIQAKGAIVLLLGIRGGLLNDRFDTEFKRLRNTHDTAYVSDVLDGLLGKREYMSDEIHPNDAGYARIAERVYPVLAPLLK